ncbi:hypothetical protein RB653_004639 [Dictyostelium firmibasis]|uniref:Uncharacterized protein n=1 Tax=Dictyostelium firmibasis TaxID=79012 RepID=A0AAN7TZZ7_9MYCE
MARSLRSKRRLRNVRIQAEKLAPFNKKVLEEIIEKREEHFRSQSVDAENLNIPPELRALNNLNKKEEQTPMVDENKNVESDSDNEDEDMEDGDKKVKKTPVHLSHKDNKTKYAKLYIKRQKAKKNARKIKPII